MDLQRRNRQSGISFIGLLFVGLGIKLLTARQV